MSLKYTFQKLSYRITELKRWPHDRVYTERMLQGQVSRMGNMLASLRSTVDQMKADLYKEPEPEVKEEEPLKPTNSEVLRKLSDDTLAHYLAEFADCSHCPARNLTCRNNAAFCHDAWLEWLGRRGR